MSLAGFAVLALASGQTPTGVQYVYDAEVLSNGAMSPSTLTITAQGSRLRLEGSAVPFQLVMDA